MYIYIYICLCVCVCACVYLVVLLSVTSSSVFSVCRILVCRNVVGLPGHKIVSSLGDTSIPATLDSESASVRCSFNLTGFPYSIVGNKADVFNENLFLWIRVSCNVSPSNFYVIGAGDL